MPDESSPLIHAAVRPFQDDAEQEMAARQLLEELGIAENGTGAMIARWQAVDLRKRRWPWRAGVYALLILESAIVLSDTARTIPTSKSKVLSAVLHPADARWEEKLAHALEPQEALLLFGDESKQSSAERMKVLWESDPQNAGWFAMYVNEYGALPPDFLQTARHIDPENAWFTCIAAGVKARGSFRTPARWASDGGRHISHPDWDVLDAAKLKEALELLREARSQPKMESYRTEVGRARAKLLPDQTPEELAATRLYFTKISLSDLHALGDLGRAMAARAWLCGEENDPAALEALERDADALFRKLTEAEVDSLLSEQLIGRIASDYFTSAAAAARKLGLAEALGRMEPIRAALEKSQTERNHRTEEGLRFLPTYGPANSWMVVGEPWRNCHLNPPFLTEGLVKPLRLAEHEMVTSAAMHGAWVVLLLAMGAAGLARLRSPQMIRQLCGRFERLVVARDWVWVIGLGIALPALYFWGITRWTPLGARGLNVELGTLRFAPDLSSQPLWLLQSLGLAGLIIYSVAVVACWRLSQRTRPLGLGSGTSWSLLVPIACLIAFIPVSGWAVVHHSPWAGAAAGWLGGIGVGWILPVAWVVFLGGLKTQLRHGTLARMLVPAYGISALLTVGAVPIFKSHAAHWSAQDTLVRRDRDHPADSIFSHKAAMKYRKDLRDVLVSLNSPR